MMRIEAGLPNQVIRASKDGNAQSKAAKSFVNAAAGSRCNPEDCKAAVRKYITNNQNNPSLITDMFVKGLYNALFNAIWEHGDVEMVSILLDAGFKVNVACHLQSNSTPLMCAAEKGKLDIVKLLLERGADLLRHNGEGKTAEELATEKEQFAVANFLKQKREEQEQVEKPPTRADNLAQSMDENAVEPLFCCPISQRIMQKPITVLTGATYDADALANAFIVAGNPHSIPCVVVKGGRINREELHNPVNLVVDSLIKKYVLKHITKAEVVGPSSVGEEKGVPSQGGLFSASRALDVPAPGINSAAHNNSSAAVQVAALSSSDEAAATSAEVVTLHTLGLKVG